MKPLTRYIGLLLIGGLMFSSRHHDTYIIGSAYKACCYQAKTQLVKESQQCESGENGFSFFKDVIANILPALKSLN
jgi:hypothetical protein